MDQKARHSTALGAHAPPLLCLYQPLRKRALMSFCVTDVGEMRTCSVQWRQSRSVAGRILTAHARRPTRRPMDGQSGRYRIDGHNSEEYGLGNWKTGLATMPVRRLVRAARYTLCVKQGYS